MVQLPLPSLPEKITLLAEVFGPAGGPEDIVGSGYNFFQVLMRSKYNFDIITKISFKRGLGF